MNQSLAILAKLNRNKTLLALIAFFLISSCWLFGPKQEKVHAQVFCPELGIKTLVRDVNAAEFLEALNNFYNYKQKYFPAADYTALIFRNGHSMQFKVKVEDMLQCTITDVRWSEVHPHYTYDKLD